MGIAVVEAPGGLPVTQAAGGIPVDVLPAGATYGIPVVLTTDGRGMPVVAVSGAFGGGSGGSTANLRVTNAGDTRVTESGDSRIVE